MTVGELIEKLREYDPNIAVGGTGHFGDLLELYDVSLVSNSNRSYVHIKNEDFMEFFNQSVFGEKTREIGVTTTPAKPFVALSIEWAGNEPD